MIRLALLVALLAVPAQAQVIGDRVEANCASVARGDITNSTVTVICGMPHEQVVRLVALAASADAGDRETLLHHLRAIVPGTAGVSVEAVARFLAILGEAEVAEAQLADRFAQIAEEHVRLLAEIRRFRVADPEVQAHREAAARALEGVPDHDRARAELAAGRALVRAKREAVARVLADQQREEASLVREQARLEAGRLRHAEAARLYEEAAALLPEADRERRWSDLFQAGRHWTDQGEVRGDSPALRRAVVVYQQALSLAPRERAPLDWAATQNNVGIALTILGWHGDGAALREGLSAYRAALEERTRERVPLDWAATQNSLGAALYTLGTRGDDAALEEAVAAFRAALEERTRERVPLDWAATQSNLGGALLVLGERGDDAALREAVTALSAALEERTRARVPLDWAAGQNNLGAALWTLGARGDDAALRDAVIAYRAALEEWTRERVPLDWAGTQNNLGLALATLGERGDEAALRDSVVAFRAALEEHTRAHVPLYWAMTMANLALALRVQAERNRDVALIVEALAAIDGAIEEFAKHNARRDLDKARRNREGIVGTARALGAL